MMMLSGTALIGGPTAASAMELEAGARIGTGWNLLTQPTDPAGAPTLLHGSAFTGGSFLVGPSAGLILMEMDGATIRLTGDLLYGMHRGAGFAEHSDGRRIDLSMTSHVLRLPVMVEVSNRAERISPTLAAGVEPIIGLASSTTVEQVGYHTAEPLENRPGSGLALAVALGAALNRGDFTLPLDLRFSWNPFVGSSTAERFDDFQILDAEAGEYAHGAYRVGFDWQIMMTAGLRWNL